MKKRKFYAVAQGRQPGIYDTWEACKSQVDGYRGCQYKSFVLRGDAERYLVESSVSASLPSNSMLQRPGKDTKTEPDASSYSNQSITFTSQSELEKYLGLPPVTLVPRLELNCEQSKLEGMKAKLQSLSTPLSSLYEEIDQLEHNGASKGNPGATDDGAPFCHSDGLVDASSFMNQSATFSSQRELENYLGLQTNTSIPILEENFVQSKLEGKRPEVQSLSTPLSSSSKKIYQLEFDGASKGNPGAAGAGALLRYPDGSVLCKLTERLGTTTNNVAEYRALILGLREALRLGIKHIKVKGDSMLVCQQVLGRWKINKTDLRSLCEEAKQLIKEFSEFSICHVDRAYNSDADALANKALELPNEP